jgi:hypothetical protein
MRREAEIPEGLFTACSDFLLNAKIIGVMKRS